ncbi:hypothetical protein [Streptomyces liliifuscus]|uniref:Uncharacterized protein n=1 Tax=Streptomyces liliifuscus TaxID=2797636 RepID=A0A7T7KY13_9ACTN|nr:hypothetical protein [Streptomyces liliifuscus]QQM42812.1 hypothetical protein JEQ17_27580 [Streptomyces liliifuscus]
MGDRSEWRDTSSGSPRTTDSEFSQKQKTFRAYMDHSMQCPDCDYGNRRCDVAQGIWEAWRALPR